VSALPAGEPRDAVARLRAAIGGVVHGKPEAVDLALATVLAGGHLLVEDVPGVGKTTLASALARAIGGSFSRVQFTADLLPTDITGCGILEPGTGRFAFRAGPIFANVLMADEINRTSPKTQSALFEAMEEGRVTVDGETRQLPKPFVVIATQNPFDHHGTFPLPESQLDRFLMRIHIGYPDREAERAVLRRPSVRAELPDAVVTPDELVALERAVIEVAVPAEVEEYLLDLVRATREDSRLVRGVSTRGAQALYRAIRARAFVAGRNFVVPEDVLDLAVPVLAHRVVARIDGGAGGEGGARAIQAVVDGLPAPW
jgi:MoxR-like ATPase